MLGWTDNAHEVKCDCICYTIPSGTMPENPECHMQIPENGLAPETLVRDFLFEM